MDKEKCGAKTRNGGTCDNWAMKNGRCRLHGGKSLKGKNSPRWESGIYSKYAESSLANILDELQDVDTEELIQPESEIKLMQGLLVRSKSLSNGVEDVDDLDTLSKIIERLILAKQRSQSIMMEQEQLIAVEDIQGFFRFMTKLLAQKYGQNEANEVMSQLKEYRLTEN